MIEDDPQQVVAWLQTNAEIKLRLIVVRYLVLDRTADARLLQPLPVGGAHAADEKQFVRVADLIQLFPAEAHDI